MFTLWFEARAHSSFEKRRVTIVPLLYYFHPARENLHTNLQSHIVRHSHHTLDFFPLRL